MRLYRGGSAHGGVMGVESGVVTNGEVSREEGSLYLFGSVSFFDSFQICEVRRLSVE